MTIPSVPPPAGIPRPLVIQMRPDWSFVAESVELLGPDGQRISPFSELPAGSSVRPAIPDLAGNESAELNDADRELQQFVHVILPETLDPEAWLETVRRWPAVESAYVAPQCELPGMSGPMV